MDQLFTTLASAMANGFLSALVASFSWGVLSVLLSPCHLSSIPLIIGFLGAQDSRRTAHGFTLSLTFGAGILITIAIMGVLTAALGRMLGDVGPYGIYVVAAVFILMGLYLMDLLPLPDIGMNPRPVRLSSTHLSALVLGLVFGVALGPCTFAYMAPVLAVVFSLADANVMAAGSLLFAFGLGHSGVIAGAGTLTARVQRYLDWTNRSNAVLWMKRVAGFCVVLGGIYALYTA